MALLEIKLDLSRVADALERIADGIERISPVPATLPEHRPTRLIYVDPAKIAEDEEEADRRAILGTEDAP